MELEPVRDKYLLTVPEAAKYLAMSVRQLRRKLAFGEIPAKRDGRLVKFRIEDLERYANNLEAWDQ